MRPWPAGTVVTLGTMIVLEINAEALDGIYANEPIYFGLGTRLLVYVAVSLLTKPTDPAGHARPGRGG